VRGRCGISFVWRTVALLGLLAGTSSGSAHSVQRSTQAMTRPLPLPAASWLQCDSIVPTIEEAKRALAPVKLQRSEKADDYYEGIKGGKVKQTDWEWKEIGLGIMPLPSEETRTLRIIKRGIDLECPNTDCALAFLTPSCTFPLCSKIEIQSSIN